MHGRNFISILFDSGKLQTPKTTDPTDATKYTK